MSMQPPGYDPRNPGQPTMARPVSVARPVGAPLPARPVQPGAAGAARPVPLQPGLPAAGQTEESPDEDLAKRIQHAMPAWLISLIAHLILFVILALIIIGSHSSEDRTIVVKQYAEEEGEQLEDSFDEIKADTPLDIAEPEFSPTPLPPVDDPLAAPDELITDLTGLTATSDMQAPVIGMALNGRQPGMKTALLAAYGGNATTEAAVQRALAWLAKQQLRDGRWSLSGPYPDGAKDENPTAATAMALLAFQGNGNTHKEGKYKEVVARGAEALLRMQKADGEFAFQGPHHARLYSQAQATIAICELYGMSRDKKYRQPAELAIQFALKAQDPQRGGWRYEPRLDSDLSVTGWFVMALQSARMARLEVPEENLKEVERFLDSVASENGSKYCYQPGKAPGLAMTAEGLLCRQYLGWKRDDPRLAAGVSHLTQPDNLLNWDHQNTYHWYYATQVLHHMEDDSWDKWNKIMRQRLPEEQVKSGPQAGSWNGPPQDLWDGHAGRLYTTCLCTYMLEVYYRHLPIYSDLR